MEITDSRLLWTISVIFSCVLTKRKKGSIQYQKSHFKASFTISLTPFFPKALKLEWLKPHRSCSKMGLSSHLKIHVVVPNICYYGIGIKNLLWGMNCHYFLCIDCPSYEEIDKDDNIPSGYNKPIEICRQQNFKNLSIKN